MNIIQFRDSILALALTVDGIEGSSHGWVQDLENDPIDYAHLRMTPPVEMPERKSDDWSTTYRVKMYMLAKNDINGKRMNDNQRDQAWADLQAMEKLFRKAIEEDSTLDLISRPGPIKYNEGHLNSNDPIWIEFDYQIRAKTPCQ